METIFNGNPNWDITGVMAPIDRFAPTAAVHSPYNATLHDFVLHFATSRERCKILRGFLNYRALLHSAGITKGFQWLDGSLIENSQLLEGGRIDVMAAGRALSRFRSNPTPTRSPWNGLKP